MTAAAARRARAQAQAILGQLLGRAPRGLRALGGGLSNHVFQARHGTDTFVIRLNDEPGKVKDYLKEQWAMAAARAQGVPVPEVLEVGAAPIPFMVSRSVRGEEATHHRRRRAVLRSLGGLLRRVHAVPTSGFGQTFDWSGNLLSRRESWAEYLQREYRGEERIAALRRHGVLEEAQARRLRATLREVAKWEVEPALSHGDPRLKNVLADAEGTVTALLDWEFCTSHAAPWWDLSLALHDLSVDAKEALLEGYGLSPAEVRERSPALRLFNVLNYAAAAGKAAKEKDKAALGWIGARLAGALDLYG
ncbi:phosphotransferase family protein [Roseococcus sp. DSY-14]|uniref:phosphotransferase family protein n=1 Tax=Roseococcus sp. DSY-14 TaxID=3369650 RepID=UPI00387B343B